MILQLGVRLLQPWPLSIALDSVFGDAPVPSIVPDTWTDATLLNVLAFAGLAFLLVRSVLSFVDARLSMRANFAIDSKVRSDVLSSVLRMPSDKRTLRDGEYDYRINTDARSVADRVLGIRLSYIYSVLLFILAAAVLLRLHVVLALIAIALTPLHLLPVRFFSDRIAAYNKRIKEKASDIRSLVIESVSQARTIQLFAKEDAQTQRFKQSMRDNYQLGINKHMLTFLFGFAESFNSVFAGSILLLIGGHQVLSGSLTAGELVVFLGYRSMLTEPLNTIVSTINEQKSAEISIDRVSEIFEAGGSDASAHTTDTTLQLQYPVQGRIDFQNVTVRRDDQTILNNVSLSIEPGTKIAIIGPSGSGKSTFINLLSRFVLPDGGHVYIDGHDISTLSLYELRNLFSIVDQSPQLFSISVEDNIAFGTPDFVNLPDRSFIADVAVVSDAFDFIMKLPDTFDSRVGKGSVALSGGQKQRIAIARALAKNSPIIIMDEPTSALDDQSARRVLSHIGSSFAGRTTVVVTHSLQLLDMMDEVYELSGGELYRVENYGTRVEDLTR